MTESARLQGIQHLTPGQTRTPLTLRGRLGRRVMMHLVRFSIVILALALWELGVNTKSVDPFFWDGQTKCGCSAVNPPIGLSFPSFIARKR